MVYKAGEQGDSDAQYYNLAISYDEGIGIEQGRKSGDLVHSKAAEQGHADAQYNFSCLFIEGGRSSVMV